jgi:hypothetical protein
MSIVFISVVLVRIRKDSRTVEATFEDSKHDHREMQ